MASEPVSDPTLSQPRSAEETLAAKLPPQVKEQPDPMLQLSVGRMGGGAIALAALAIAVVVAVVFYGLNSPAPSQQTAQAPTSPPAAGAPAPNAKP